MLRVWSTTRNSGSARRVKAERDPDRRVGKGLGPPSGEPTLTISLLPSGAAPNVEINILEATAQRDEVGDKRPAVCSVFALPSVRLTKVGPKVLQSAAQQIEQTFDDLPIAPHRRPSPSANGPETAVPEATIPHRSNHSASAG